MGVKAAILLKNHQHVDNDYPYDDKASLRQSGSRSFHKISRQNVCVAAGCFLFLFATFQLQGARCRIIATATFNTIIKDPGQSREENEHFPNIIPGATTFVFSLGLEGTGHHFLSKLVSGSPSMERVRSPEVNAGAYLTKIKKNHISGGLMAPDCNFVTGVPAESYEHVVKLLEDVNRKINGTVPFVSVNTHVDDEQMMSYPHGPCHRHSFPSMDIFHRACQEAHVNGAQVYLYRDPYEVLRSTIVNRHLNHNVGAAIHLYTMALHVMEAQLLDYPLKTLGCFGFYDINATVKELWEPLGKIFGWRNNLTAYQDYLNGIFKQPPLMSKAEKKALVPAGLEPLMREFLDGHKRVLRICREQAKLNQPHWGI